MPQPAAAPAEMPATPKPVLRALQDAHRRLRLIATHEFEISAVCDVVLEWADEAEAAIAHAEKV